MKAKKNQFIAAALVLAAIAISFYTASIGFGFKPIHQISTAPTGYYTIEMQEPQIKVEPSTTVQVGEEVFFDATGVTVPSAVLLPNGMVQGNYDWDFGDGYKMTKDYYYLSYQDGGTTVSHYYMRPGVYTVILNVTDLNGVSKTETFVINVQGEYPKMQPRPSTQPVLELKFENNLQDSSGNNGIANWVGQESYVDGIEGKAAEFSNSYIEVINSSIINQLGELTISFWARKKEANETNVILEKENAFKFYLGVYSTPASISASVTTAKTSTSSYWLAYSNNELWHHYALVYDRSNIMLYMDGQLKSITAQTGTINSLKNVYIGRGVSAAELFNGYIDEVKIYNKALTQDELTRNFELWHADFHGHTAQYIYAQIPGEITKEATNKIKATVTGDNGYSEILLQKNNLQSEEKFLLTNSKLPSGDYTLKVQLLDSGNNVLDEIKEYFEKPYDGIPKVGIDENNAFRVNGELFFPVTPFGLRKDLISGYLNPNATINSLYNEGWYPSHNIDTWKDTLNQGKINNLYVIGPGTFTGKAWRPYAKNSLIQDEVDVIEATKDNPSLLIWHLGDEPDIGAEGAYTPAEVLRSRTYKFHQYDSQHIVMTNFAGDKWVGDSAVRRSKYDYLENANQFGGKKTFACDVYSFDYYPVEWQSPSSRNAKVRQLALALDRMKELNYNLIPYMSFVETMDIADDVKHNCTAVGTPAPTPEQVKMLSWLSVVHGAKGISWFHYFCPGVYMNEDIEAATAKFLDQITRLTPAVLGPEVTRKITDNSDAEGNRVDTMVREYNGAIYLFAVRLTETTESNDITATFNAEGVSNAVAEVFDESRQINIAGGSFTDTFAPNAVHIYKIPAGASGECTGNDVSCGFYPNCQACGSAQKCCNNTCTKPACLNDVNCNDFNAATTDTCNNAGTCTAICTHTPTTECVDDTKLLGYISQWKQGNITLLALMQKMGAWKAGTGCA